MRRSELVKKLLEILPEDDPEVTVIYPFLSEADIFEITDRSWTSEVTGNVNKCIGISLY